MHNKVCIQPFYYYKPTLRKVSKMIARTVFGGSTSGARRFGERRTEVRTAAHGGSANGGLKFIEPTKRGSATIFVS